MPMLIAPSTIVSSPLLPVGDFIIKMPMLTAPSTIVSSPLLPAATDFEMRYFFHQFVFSLFTDFLAFVFFIALIFLLSSKVLTFRLTWVLSGRGLNLTD
ncbi:unnamed protein product [Prunus brigantina]